MIYFLKYSLAFLLTIVLSAHSFGQDSFSKYHEKGRHNINVGAGFPNLAKTTLDIAGLGNEVIDKVSPQYTLKYEYGVSESFGLGIAGGYYYAVSKDVNNGVATAIDAGIDIANLDFSNLGSTIGGLLGGSNTSASTSTGGSSQYRINAYAFTGRFAYHKEMIEGVDLYTATSIGFGWNQLKKVSGDGEEIDSKEVSAPTFIYNVVGGGRLFLIDNIALYGELGYGALTVVNVGATLRL